jgi:chorismate synthase
MNNILDQLDKIDKEIKKATAEKNQMAGALSNIISNIKKSYGVETDQEIKAKIEEMSKELDSIGTKIETKFEDLQENYSWEE